MERFIKAQGDVTIISLHGWTEEEHAELGIPRDIPAGTTEAEREGGSIIVAHSETGHHHVINDPDARMFDADELTSYIELPGLTQIRHLRSFDTHAPIDIPPGKYLVKRGREYTPEGWQRVQD